MNGSSVVARKPSLATWLARSIAYWLIAVTIGLVYAVVARALGVADGASNPIDDHLGFTLVFVWPGMAAYLALLWWRSSRPGFRVWAILASPFIYLLLIYIWLTVTQGPTSQGICLSAVVFGAIVPRPARGQVS